MTNSITNLFNTNTFQELENFINPLSHNRLMDKMFDNTISFSPTLRANVYKNENSCILELIVPGIDKKDIDINIEENLLVITFKIEGNEPIRKTFKLSYKVDESKISASLDKGILRIVLPKLVEEKKSTKIYIA
ncbi:MAG: Hsp20/alpha crystallin family protein [Kiritimatiellae bacterium]|nr:Hsp20/alpha crystallin family protein [Kiritimatiellia bacterium]